jgi:NADPH:quinone reductase-like Zn-dependent oxidoreductase/ubiquinone/menaquinone biosynthesis C-methylase UbiE
MWYWVHVGTKLPMIMREEIDPLEVLIQDGLLFNIYEQSSIFQWSFQQLAELVGVLSKQNPWLRILEVGAGTGGCTSRVLDRITSPSIRFETYDYNDISTGFFEAARAKFQSAGSHLNFRKLDICADVELQGFELGSYDLVIAADVIHATPDMPTSLTQIRRLLKPTGALALVELSGVTPSMFPFATLPGWWYRGNDDGAYVSETDWHSMLVESGFRGVEASLKDLPQDHLHSVIWSRPVVEASPLLRDVMVMQDTSASDGLSQLLIDQMSQLSGIGQVALDSLTTSKALKGPHVILHELHRSILTSPTSAEFAALQNLFLTATEILWVVKGSSSGSQAEDLLHDFAFGFARSIRREYAGLKFVVLQLDDREPSGHSDSIMAVFQHCFIDNSGNSDIEMDFKASGEILQFPRLVPHARVLGSVQYKYGHIKTEERPFCVEDKPLQLDMTRAGSLDSMNFIQPNWASNGQPLADDQVKIEIKASGLNFKDVLIALGSLPWQGLGRECSGVVVEVGKKLESQYQAGEKVLHWGTDLFASHATCAAETICKAPSHLDFAEAAAIPVVYSTAYECLVNVAHLKKGETVLIHAAAGGVGQAAVMLARWIGADTYCTVGTTEKKALLMSKYGISEDHIFSSRNTQFATSLLHATNSRGGDVVLNSLSDEMYRSTWSCMAIFERFIDIGKKHFVNNAHLELSPFDKSITYASVDLSLLIEHRGQYVQKLMSDVVELFNSGVLQPPEPVHRVPIANVQTVFRTMQSGKSMGKIVIVNDESSIVAAPVELNSRSVVRGDASYLITGGTGGLGRARTRWLIDMGARHIVLVSRSGGDMTADSSLKQTITWVRERRMQSNLAVWVRVHCPGLSAAE